MNATVPPHPLHDHLARALGERLPQHRIVLVYDPEARIGPFVVRELPCEDEASPLPGLAAVRVGAVSAHLARYDGSFFGLRAAVEPIAGQDRPDPLLVYLPLARPDEAGFPLLELERAGTSYTVQFKRLARTLLQTSYTNGQIDELLERPGLSYDDVAALLSQAGNGEGPPSVLRTIFGGLASEPLLTRWLADESLTYLQLADRVEDDLRLANATIDAARLGSVDTFRFEERRLLEHAAQAICEKRYDEALDVVTGRQRSFWVDRDLDRQARWTACRLLAALGQEIARIAPLLGRLGSDPAAWIAAYADERGGWHRVDGLQRELESWVAQMDDDLDDVSRKAHGVVRHEHDELLKRMAESFGRAFRAAGWTASSVLHQTHVYPDVVKAAAGRMAYFVVDALRYEMGVALVRLLDGNPDLAIRPAVAALPTITPVGMAALLPGAAESFSVVQHGSKLAARIESSALTGLADRQRAIEARVPGVVDLTLEDVIQHGPSWLSRKVDRAPLVVVRSQEIDMMGELGNDRLARWVMDAVVGDLAQAIY